MNISSGVRYMLLASFFFSLMQVCVKFLPHIPAIEIVFFRSLVSLVISYLALKRARIPPFGKKKPILIARGGVGAVALILFFLTIQKMPLAGAVTFQFLSPIFTAILGVFIVSERVSIKQYLFFGISFMGIVVIKGFDDRIPLLYATLGIISAVFSGLAYNIIRKIKTSEHPLVIVLYFPLVTLPITAIYCLFFWVQPNGMDWFWLLMTGIFTQLAQYYMTMSYQQEDLSTVAILKYIGIIYAVGFGYFLFDEHLPWGSVLGIVLVLGGAILNVRYKTKKAAG
jgi:drug/metabolite transporter (DMT)-like permease